MRVETADLIGTPWEELDCGGLVSLILQRFGIAPSEFPRTRSCDPIRMIEEYGAGWVKIGDRAGDATRCCDVIVSDPTRKGESIHLSVVVDDSPRRVITSVDRFGVVRASAMPSAEVVGVYRPKCLAGRIEP